MDDAFAAFLLRTLPGLTLGATARDAASGVSVEGLAVAPAEGGAIEIRAARLEARALRLAADPFVLEVGQAAVHGLRAVLLLRGGRPHLQGLQATGATLADVKLHGPLGATPARAKAAGRTPSAASARWSLGPLAEADGTVRARITDAHLLFDADVTVPVRQGRIHFADATVAHVGPDSRMGVSRMGIYVDAPNGRSYLYQFAAAPVAGVTFERRGTLLGPWVSDRGDLRLQEFGEGLLRQGAGGAGQGFTDQARQLLDRTAVSGELRLGDGTLAGLGLQAELSGRAGGHNTIRLQSDAVGRGIAVNVDAFLARQAVLRAAGLQWECGEASGALRLALFGEGGALRFTLELARVEVGAVQAAASAGPAPGADAS